MEIYMFISFCVCFNNIKALNFNSIENDSTVMTEYNDGNLYDINANGFIVDLTTYETEDDYGNIIGLMFSSRISVIRRSYLRRTMLLLIC